MAWTVELVSKSLDSDDVTNIVQVTLTDTDTQKVYNETIRLKGGQDLLDRAEAKVRDKINLLDTAKTGLSALPANGSTWTLRATGPSQADQAEEAFKLAHRQYLASLSAVELGYLDPVADATLLNNIKADAQSKFQIQFWKYVYESR